MKVQPESLCMGCMEPTGGACPSCGWREETGSSSALYLRTRTVLDGRYLLGRVLGAGGFGVTYLGWDLNLGMKLAIKEYFPSGFGARDLDRSTVIPSTSQGREMFDRGLSRFLEEGQALAKFQGHPGIASVMNYFPQNGTAYLVMKYEDGITLHEFLRQSGGRIDYQRAMSIAMPVMDALRAVHGQGILHRDISPDNIYINCGGQVKILDFGSAKHDLANQNKSTQLTLKRGYSPEEQYRSSGKVGPWTDVYAMGATIYQAITGEVPPEALDRLDEDTLQSPAALGIQIPQEAGAAIMRAMSVRPAGRFQTIKEFQDALIAAGEVTPAPPPSPLPSPRPEPTRWPLWAGLAAGLLCLVALAWWAMIPPRVLRFDAEPAAIVAGGSATLRWAVDRGSVTIEPGVGRLDGTTGERPVSPAATTTYILTTRGRLRSVRRAVIVTVSPPPGKILEPRSVPAPEVAEPAKPKPPRIARFDADPPAVSPGQASTLTWSTDGDVRDLSLLDIAVVRPRGSYRVNPAATTKYTLVASGPAGSDSRSVTVTVTPQPVSQQPATTPPPGSLHIETVDLDNGQPISATIEIESTGAGPPLNQSISGPDYQGSFPPGDYKITVTLKGYSSANTTTTVFSGVQRTVRVGLPKAPQ